MFRLLRGRRLRFIRGAVIGGALVYFLDPEQGRARRAKAAEQVRTTSRRLVEQVNQGTGGGDTSEIWGEPGDSSPEPMSRPPLDVDLGRPPSADREATAFTSPTTP
jgi:hypothetical protein